MAIGVTDIIETAGKAIAPVTATLSDTWSALIGDRVAAWRLRNAADLQKLILEKLDGLGLSLDTSKVPERYAISWFEEATKQDEPDIQDIFARLLVRAAAGETDALDRRHLDIITRLTPLDAQVFQWFFASSVSPRFPSMGEFEAWKEVKAELGSAAWLSIEHLMVLGVVERRFDNVHKERSFGVAEEWTAVSEIAATERGMSLSRACRPDAVETTN